MDINITGICITVLIGVICLSLAIFLGLRGFTGKLGKKVEQAKDDIVAELSGINEKIVKIDTNTDNLVQLANAYLTSASGTIVKRLKNFGDTKISAQPGTNDTTYIIRVEKGILNASMIDRLSKKTGLSTIEIKRFGRETKVTNLGSNTLRVIIPSTDPKICTGYMGELLTWIDTKYHEGTLDFVAEFENGINVKSSD